MASIGPGGGLRLVLGQGTGNVGDAQGDECPELATQPCPWPTLQWAEHLPPLAGPEGPTSQADRLLHGFLLSPDQLCSEESQLRLKMGTDRGPALGPGRERRCGGGWSSGSPGTDAAQVQRVAGFRPLLPLGRRTEASSAGLTAQDTSRRVGLCALQCVRDREGVVVLEPLFVFFQLVHLH